MRDPELISIDPPLKGDYGLHGYFQRYARISLKSSDQALHRFLLLPTEGVRMNKIPEGYEKVSLRVEEYALYEKR